MRHRGETETESMDSALTEFTYVAQADGSVLDLGPEVIFLGIGCQVRWGNALARLGVCLDRDRMTWRVQYGDRYSVSTASAEFTGNVAVLADEKSLQLIERQDPEADIEPGTCHSIPWDAITRVGIIPAVIDSPECA